MTDVTKSGKTRVRILLKWNIVTNFKYTSPQLQQQVLRQKYKISTTAEAIVAVVATLKIMYNKNEPDIR